MTTLELEIALMSFFGIRANLIVPNVSWGIGNLHECDLLILSKHHYATEVEIKISKSDLLKDKNKSHNHIHNYIRRLYFAVPEKLKDIALSEIPSGAGLISAKKIQCKPWHHLYSENSSHNYYFHLDVIRNPALNSSAHKWTDTEYYMLQRLGAMRILSYKKKLLRLQYAANFKKKKRQKPKRNS